MDNRPRPITPRELECITQRTIDFDHALDHVTWVLRRAREIDAFLRFFPSMCSDAIRFQPKPKIHQDSENFIGCWGNGAPAKLVKFMAMHLKVPLFVEYMFTESDFLPVCDTAGATANQRSQDLRRKFYSANLEGSDEFKYPSPIIDMAKNANWPTIPFDDPRWGMPEPDAEWKGTLQLASYTRMGLRLKQHDRPLKEPPQPLYVLPPAPPSISRWPTAQQVAWTGMSQSGVDRTIEGWLEHGPDSVEMVPPPIMHSLPGTRDKQWSVYEQQPLYGDQVGCRMTYRFDYPELKRQWENNSGSDDDDDPYEQISSKLYLYDRRLSRVLIYTKVYTPPAIYMHPVVPYGVPLPEFQYWKGGRKQESSRWAYVSQNNIRTDPPPALMARDYEYTVEHNPPPAYEPRDDDGEPSLASIFMNSFTNSPRL
jgi:hypothetical protein